MSTNINISVGDNKLLDQARLQQNASRQAQLEKEANKRLFNEAEINRVNALAAQGKDANGNTITGTPTGLPQIERRPAANRNSEEFMLLRPTSAPTGSTIATKAKGFPLFLSGASNGTYEPTSGPNDRPALVAKQVRVVLQGLFPYPSTKSRYTAGLVDFTYEFFVKLGQTYAATQAGSRIFTSIGSQNVFRIGADLFTSFGVAKKSLNFGIAEFGGGVTDLFFAETILSDTALPLYPGVWHHIAVAKKANTIYAFLDGSLLATLVVGWTFFAFEQDQTTFSARNWVRADFGPLSTEDPIPAQDIGLHGLRFTPKALYTSSFTPPPNL